MSGIGKVAAVVMLCVALAACGRNEAMNDANLSDADNMLVPADENAAAADDGVTDGGVGNEAGAANAGNAR